MQPNSRKTNRKHIERTQERAQGINFLQVKTPTLGCLSNHYTFLFIRLKLHEDPRHKGENFYLYQVFVHRCLCNGERNMLVDPFEKPHIIIYNII